MKPYDHGYADGAAGKPINIAAYMLRVEQEEYNRGYLAGSIDRMRNVSQIGTPQGAPEDALDAYQREAARTAIYPRNENWGLVYSALGLASEAGEYAGKVKKLLRDAVWSKEAAAAELGDVLWYVAACASDLGMSLSDIARANLQKLADRKARDTLSGSGDAR